MHASIHITKNIEIKFHSSVHPHDKKNNKKIKIVSFIHSFFFKIKK